MHDNGSIAILLVGCIGLFFIILNIFFCYSLYSAMKLLPQEKQIMPAWICWFILIPLVGFIFSWILEPFVIPKSFEGALKDNIEAGKKSRTLFGLGLTHVILITLSLIPLLGLFTIIASFVIWIIYWVKIVEFKNTFLRK